MRADKSAPLPPLSGQPLAWRIGSPASRLAKLGVEGISINLPTFVRTLVMLVLWAGLLFAGDLKPCSVLPPRSLILLGLFRLAT